MNVSSYRKTTKIPQVRGPKSTDTRPFFRCAPAKLSLAQGRLYVGKSLTCFTYTTLAVSLQGKFMQNGPDNRQPPSPWTKTDFREVLDKKVVKPAPALLYLPKNMWRINRQSSFQKRKSQPNSYLIGFSQNLLLKTCRRFNIFCMEIRIFVTHGKNTKIKKERLTKLVREILFTLVAIFLLFGETCGASSASHYSKNTSENQRQKVQKQNRKTAKTLSSNKVNNPDKQFAKTVSLSGLTPDTPFGEAIDIFRNSTEPPLNIVVFWRDLEENSDVDRYTPIGIEPLSGVSLGQNLELILMSVSSDPTKLGYAVEKGVIIIATKDSLPTKMIRRIYDITDLVSVPVNYL